MEQRLILPSNSYSPPQLEGQHRLPLSEAAGNSQIHAVASPYSDTKDFHHCNSQLHLAASVGSYTDTKDSPNAPLYTIPAVPLQLGSQASRDRAKIVQLNRRQSIRRAKAQRHVQRHAQPRMRNPIEDSRQYQAYRERQFKNGGTGDEKDVKWPDILEKAFLDALVLLPRMGRRKFTMAPHLGTGSPELERTVLPEPGPNKPHGRNEMLREYLWISYCQSLPPGIQPDWALIRTRKQVSSHIQVLKGFFRDHPQFHLLFPPKEEKARNGFEDSFKDDPCLLAIRDNRLPRQTFNYDLFGNDMHQQPQLDISSICPHEFWMHIRQQPNKYSDSKKPIHVYSSSAKRIHNGSLDSIPNWRNRFPHLVQLYLAGEVTCDIIHMNVALHMYHSSVPEGSRICLYYEISVQGQEHPETMWQSVTSLMRPVDLHRDLAVDPVVDKLVEECERRPSTSATESYIRLKLPSTPWAYMLSYLSEYEYKFGDRKGHAVRDMVEQISLFQDLKSTKPNSRTQRRGIVLWTFHVAEPGEEANTMWRYIDSTPSRSKVMSPSPNHHQHFSAAMNENFGSLMENHHQQNFQSPFKQSAVPTSLGSPFGGHDYGGYPSDAYEMSFKSDSGLRNMSFMSQSTVDSDTTLANNHDTPNMDSFLSDGMMEMGYEHGAAWQLNQGVGVMGVPSFGEGLLEQTWNVPVNTPQIWDAAEKGGAWPEVYGEEWDGGDVVGSGWPGTAGYAGASGAANEVWDGHDVTMVNEMAGDNHNHMSYDGLTYNNDHSNDPTMHYAAETHNHGHPDEHELAPANHNENGSQMDADTDNDDTNDWQDLQPKEDPHHSEEADLSAIEPKLEDWEDPVDMHKIIQSFSHHDDIHNLDTHPLNTHAHHPNAVDEVEGFEILPSPHEIEMNEMHLHEQMKSFDSMPEQHEHILKMSDSSGHDAAGNDGWLSMDASGREDEEFDYEQLAVRLQQEQDQHQDKNHDHH